MYDLDMWFEGQTAGTVFERPIGRDSNTTEKIKVIQLCGIEVVLYEDGTYTLSDTTG